MIRAVGQGVRDSGRERKREEGRRLEARHRAACGVARHERGKAQGGEHQECRGIRKIFRRELKCLTAVSRVIGALREIFHKVARIEKTKILQRESASRGVKSEVRKSHPPQRTAMPRDAERSCGG